MPIHNSEVAETLSRFADLLEIEGANQFRIRAYRNAARIIGGLPQRISELVEKDSDLTDLPGIGKDLAGKITEIVRTGTLSVLQELEARVPPELSELMRLSNLGPRRVQVLSKELGIKTLDQLKKAAEEQKIRDLAGFGEKTERHILEEVERRQKGAAGKRVLLSIAEEITQPLLAYLKKIKGVGQVEAAGSYRRRVETIGDLDIIVTCASGSPVMDRFIEFEDVRRVIAKGETRSSVVLRSEFQVDLRVVPDESFGAAICYFTGSKAHNIAIRTMGVQRKLKINEYGVFKGEKKLAGRTETEVYKSVGLPYIEPELREDRGEFEAARNGKLPKLVTLKDIRGDLQSHTTNTDGKFTMEEMAEAAKERGYEYLAITDHSKRVTMARGLDEKRLLEHIRKVDKYNEKSKGFIILKSIEVDILKDGSLDLSDDVLKELDVVVCSIHYNMNLPRDKQTERVLRAMDNPYFHILAHPTGRLMGVREPYEIDLEKVIEKARKNGCFLELNAQPDRLDLTDIYCKMAKEMGVKIAISTDAHSIANFDFMKYGVAQARRGWLEPEDVLNTRSWEELKKLLKRK